MALKQRTTTNALIHHSDRGIQFCSKEYVNTTLTHNVIMSMTENGDPYENALAERMNRTLKEQFGLYRTFNTKQQAKDVIKDAVDLYNDKRPHLLFTDANTKRRSSTKNPGSRGYRDHLKIVNFFQDETL